jgi:hypothetical protein
MGKHGRHMLKIKLSVAFVACLLLFATKAKADSFTLTATSGGATVISATLTGTELSPGVYDITGMSGIVGGSTNVSLLATSGVGAVTASGVVNGWYILYDDLLYLNAPYVDYWGLGFTANGELGNLYYSGGDLYAELGNTMLVPGEAVSVSVVQTPEPSSLALLVSGMLALMLLVIRRGRA